MDNTFEQNQAMLHDTEFFGKRMYITLRPAAILET